MIFFMTSEAPSELRMYIRTKEKNVYYQFKFFRKFWCALTPHSNKKHRWLIAPHFHNLISQDDREREYFFRILQENNLNAKQSVEFLSFLCSGIYHYNYRWWHKVFLTEQINHTQNTHKNIIHSNSNDDNEPCVVIRVQMMMNAYLIVCMFIRRKCRINACC